MPNETTCIKASKFLVLAVLSIGISQLIQVSTEGFCI